MNPTSTIGIDPALTNLGVVHLHAGSPTMKLIRPKNVEGIYRLDFIHKEIQSFIELLPCDLVVIEGYDYKGHNLAQLGEASGIIKLLCHQLGLSLLVVAPAAVKKFATGTSQASKQMMMARYQMDNEHLADARALAEIGQAYLTGNSMVRHELEVIKNLKSTKEEKPRVKQNLARLAVAL